MASDRALLDRYVENHDPGAFAQLVSRYADFAYGLARRRSPEGAQSEQPVKEAFEALAQNSPSVSFPLADWFHATISRSEQPGPAVQQATEPTWAEMADHVHAAIPALPQEVRAPILLRYLDGRSPTETAEFIGADEKSTPKWLQMGIRELHRRLEEAGFKVTLMGLHAGLEAVPRASAPAAFKQQLAQLAYSGVGRPTFRSRLAPIGVAAGRWYRRRGKATASVGLVLVAIGTGGILLYQRMDNIAEWLHTARDEAERSHARAANNRPRPTPTPQPTYTEKLKEIESGKFFTIDLRKHCTTPMTEPREGDELKNDWSCLPVGQQEFRGVPFDIIDQKTNNDLSMIELITTKHERTELPKEVTGIDFGNRKAKRLYFLHTMGWGSEPGELGQYRVHYQGREEPEVIPIVNDKNITDWWNPREVSEAYIGWIGSNGLGKVGIHVFPWVNPRPDLPIASVDFVSNDVGPILGLAALTAEE